MAAATIGFDEIFAQNLLSKNCFLLRPLFKGGYYLRAATNKDFTVDIRGLVMFWNLTENKQLSQEHQTKSG